MKKLSISIFLIFLFISCTSQNRKHTLSEQINLYNNKIEKSINSDNYTNLNLYLKMGFNSDYKNNAGKTLLMKIVQKNSINCLNTILLYKPHLENQMSIDGTTKRAIDFVTSRESLDLLIKNGVNINYINNKKTPLIINYIKYKPYNLVKELISKGVKLDVVDEHHLTPLMWAVVKNRNKIVRLLLDKKVDINKKDFIGNTAIYYAYNEDIILMLLKSNLNKNIKNTFGKNILTEVYLRCIANSYHRAIKKLLAVDINKKNYKK